MITIPRTTPIPRWWLAAYAPDIPKAYELFSAFLAGLSLSLTDLAKDIGVDQSTISRWAVGRSRPRPEQMKAVLLALQLRLKAMAADMQHIMGATEALQGVVGAFEASLESDSSGQTAAGEIRRAARKLHVALKDFGVGHGPTKHSVEPKSKRRLVKSDD